MVVRWPIGILPLNILFHTCVALSLSLSLFVSLRLAYQRHSLAVDKKRNLLLDLLPDNLRFFFFKNHSDSAGLVPFDFVSHFLSFPSHFFFVVVVIFISSDKTWRYVFVT